MTYMEGVQVLKWKKLGKIIFKTYGSDRPRTK